MPSSRIVSLGQALYPGCRSVSKQSQSSFKLPSCSQLAWLSPGRIGGSIRCNSSSSTTSPGGIGASPSSSTNAGQATLNTEYNAAGMHAGALPGLAPRICILGGGFGGLYTAVRLQSLLWPQGKRPQVTLIDKSDKFVFKPLLYEIVNGTAKPEEVAPTFVKLLSPYTVNFVQGSVESIQPHELPGSSSQSKTSSSGGKILLNNGSALDYDWLVLSMGSESNTFGIPGVKELAVLFNTIDDALQCEREVQLLQQAQSSTVVVVGSGPAGVELATTVADKLGKKTLVQLVSTGPEILKGAPGTHRDAAEKVLRQKGISVIRERKVTKLREGSQMGATLKKRRIVELVDKAEQKQDVEADLVLWTTGSQPSSKAKKSMELPFPCNDKGAMKTYDTLQIVGNPHVFALGDLASSAVEGQQLDVLPATAQVAFQQADYAAWNIWAAIHNRPLLPFRYQHLGDMMSLGIADGAVTFPIQVPRELSNALQNGVAGNLLKLAGIRLSNGDEKGVTLEGNLGALVRRAAYLYRQPTSEHRWEVGSNWFQQAFQQAGTAFNRR